MTAIEEVRESLDAERMASEFADKAQSLQRKLAEQRARILEAIADGRRELERNTEVLQQLTDTLRELVELQIQLTAQYVQPLIPLVSARTHTRTRARARGSRAERIAMRMSR